MTDLKASDYDPELFTLRTIARSDEGRKTQLETARFGLWSALHENDHARALRWLDSCETVVSLLLDHDLARQGAQAIGRIRQRLEAEK